MRTLWVPVSAAWEVLCKVRCRLRCSSRSWSTRVMSLIPTLDSASTMMLPTLPSPTMPTRRLADGTMYGIGWRRARASSQQVQASEPILMCTSRTMM